MRLAAVALAVLALAAAGSAQEPRRPKITGVSHAAFFVHDMEKARAFYNGLLGLPEIPARAEAGAADHPTVFKVNGRQCVELLREREAGGDRLSHIALETDDADAMRRYLAARGIRVPERMAKTPSSADASFTIRDPDGHDLEFVQNGRTADRGRQQDREGRPTSVSSDMRHVGILVGSLDAALAFYGEVLGFHETWRGSRDEKELNWVNLQVPDGQDYVEFMLYRDVPEPSKRGSQHHICLFVPDIGRALGLLQPRAAAIGYTTAMEPRTGINRKRQLNLFDPDGTRTELMEPATIDGVPTPSSAAPPPRR